VRDGFVFLENSGRRLGVYYTALPLENLHAKRPEGSRPTAFILHFSISITHFPIIAEQRELPGEVREDFAFWEKSGRRLGFH